MTTTPTTEVEKRRRVRRRHDDGQARRQGHDHDRHQVRPAAVRPARSPSGEPEGFDVEIGKIIAAKLGIEPDKIKWVETVSANREPFIQERQGRHRRRDVHDQRRAQGDRRTSPARTSSPASILVKEDNDRSTGPDDLAGKKVCSVEGSTPTENIEENYPDVKLALIDTYSNCLEPLRNDQVDAITTDDVDPARLRRAERRRVQGRRRDVHRGAVRHRAEEGRQGVPHVHQRHARGVVQGRLVGGGLGGDAGSRCSDTPEPPAVDRY